MKSTEERRLRLNQLRMIVIIMIVLFVALLSYTIGWLVSYNKKYGYFVKTEAEVFDHEEVDGKTYDVIKYFVDGNEHHLRTEYTTKNDVGDKITIYYDKNNPMLGVIYSRNPNRIILPVLTSIFGCGCIALVCVYISICKDVKRSEMRLQMAKENADEDIDGNEVTTLADDSDGIAYNDSNEEMNGTNAKTLKNKTKSTSKNQTKKRSTKTSTTKQSTTKSNANAGNKPVKNQTSTSKSTSTKTTNSATTKTMNNTPNKSANKIANKSKNTNTKNINKSK